ncbi:methionine S-methyltransferase [Ranunculus cassubicifolius]
MIFFSNENSNTRNGDDENSQKIIKEETALTSVTTRQCKCSVCNLHSTCCSLVVGYLVYGKFPICPPPHFRATMSPLLPTVDFNEWGVEIRCGNGCGNSAVTIACPYIYIYIYTGSGDMGVVISPNTRRKLVSIGSLVGITHVLHDAYKSAIVEGSSHEHGSYSNVVVFPSRAVAIENALRLFLPRLAIVDEQLTRHLPKQWLTSLAYEEGMDAESSDDVITVIEAPRQSDLMIDSSFGHFLETTRDVGARLFLDISDQLELSSLPGSNGVLKYLAGNTLPPHTAIFCGLIKNKVYSDLEVAFVISEEESIFKALSKTVEFLDGHTALFSEYYYGIAAIFESFARQNMVEAETDVKTSLQKFIKSNYGFPTNGCEELIYADTPLSLFNKLVSCCIQEGGTLCLSSGSNGTYVSAAKFMKAKIVNVQTSSDTGFKLSGHTLTDSLKGVVKPWVYLSGPTVNPTGSLYSNQEIQEILSVCAKFGARLVIDTSFSGLEFNSEGWGGWNLADSLSKLSCPDNSFCVSLLGGLSFEMLTGGLTFGFLVLNQPLLIDAFHSFPSLSKPHSTVKYAVKKLLNLKAQNDKSLLDAVSEQKGILRSRYERLKETLKSNGWDVVECYGGVSMVAKPSSYLGKNLKLEAFEAKLGDSNIREAMLKSTGLCINSGSWTGIPGYCRFTVALEEKEFEQALECITKFHKAVTGSS